MTPNATVSYMAAQAERQLVEAKAARAWIVDEAARNRTTAAALRLPERLGASRATRTFRFTGRPAIAGLVFALARGIPRRMLPARSPVK
jgi:hypothetical protein